MSARILIIEDNPANMELMTYLLQAFGHIVLSAYNGEDGLEMARRELPDLVICDVHLPGMDGYGVLKQLKCEALLRRIPVIAVTALAMVGDRQKLLAAGFDGYLGKPIEPELFVGQVEQFLRIDLRSAPRVPETPALAPDEGAAPSAGHGKILVVDDLLPNREFLRCTLEPCGYEVVLASTVRQGVARVQETRFDMILCDLHMPDEDGIAFMALVKADQRQCTVPFVFISAALEDAAHQTCIEQGAMHFIQRPIEPRMLIGEIENCLRAARAMGAMGYKGMAQ